MSGKREWIGILAAVVPALLWLHFGPESGGVVAFAWVQALAALAGAGVNRLQAGFDNPYSTQSSEDQLKILTSPFNSGAVQALLPSSLRFGPIEGQGRKGDPSPFARGDIEPFINAGVRNLGLLAAFPGVLSPTVSPALSAQAALQSGGAKDASQIQAQRVVDRLSKSGSEMNPLAQAISNISASAGQRGVQGGALSQTDQLWRSDTQQTYNLLDAVLQFLSSGRGQSVAGLQGAAQLAQSQKAMQQQFQASQLAAMGSGLSGLASGRA